jgi:serine/threonine protein kinase
VHRDVSIGNILSYRGHAKLADLEYAKKKSDFTRHDLRTASDSPITLSGKSLNESQQGTMHFMSIEVAAQKFLFRPLPKLDMNDLISVPKGKALAKILFSPNHLHDLESLWWVAVWTVFYNHFSKKGTQSPSVILQDAEEQFQLAQALFPSVQHHNTRDHIFQNTGAFEELYDKLPENNRPFGPGLDIIRQLLITHYLAVEAKCPEFVDLESSPDRIYDSFINVFSSFVAESRDLEYNFIPVIRKKLLKEESLKRPRSESTTVGTGGPSALKTQRI